MLLCQIEILSFKIIFIYYNSILIGKKFILNQKFKLV